MPRDYYPRREADIVAFTSNFSQKISLDPAAYGLTPLQASAYAIPVANFASAWQIVRNNSANSSSAYAAKEIARVTLENATRPLVAIVQAHPATTNEMGLLLGLPPRAKKRKKIPSPDTAPFLRIDEVNGHSIKLRLIDAASGARRKAIGAKSAALFCFAGHAPPADLAHWRFLGITTRTLVTLSLPPAIQPGEKVWLCAHWQSPRAARGPISQPISTHAQSGVSQPRERQLLAA